MPRRVWPHSFRLFGATLDAADASSRSKEAIAALQRSYPRAVFPHPSGRAIALRWLTTPLLGFPRKPFRLYRRPSTRQWESLAANVAVKDYASIEWNLRGMYEVMVVVTPAAGASLRVDAFDVRRELIPEQRVKFTAAGGLRFRVPGICGLRVQGSGTVSGVFGVDENALANQNDWQLAEIVGLPFADGEAALPVYDPQLQGPAPGFVSGLDAAINRANIARLLAMSMPATGVADFPAPAWPVPHGALYLHALRGSPIAPFRLIRDCLTHTNDADPHRMQADYIHTASNLPGIRQLGAQGGGTGADPTAVSLPVVACTMLSVSSESLAATALGYGTVDFPPVAAGPTIGLGTALTHMPAVAGAAELPFDYMVTAQFTVPQLGTFEVAALAEGRAAPTAASGLSATALHSNRPTVRDAEEAVAVRLDWNLSTRPQAYALIASRQPNQSELLNTKQLGGGFELYVPIRPGPIDGDLPIGAHTSFIDQVAPVPITGSRTSRYMIIAQDVFQRWSPWAPTDYTANAPAVTKPAINSASFVQHPDQAVGHAVPCELELEFSWDWADRSPDRVEFTGKFFPAGANPDPEFVAGLAVSPNAQPGAVLVVKFDNNGVPSIASGYTGSVEILKYDPPDPNHPPDVNQPRYRAVIQGFTCDFTNAPQLAFELYARGAERVRPNELSDLIGPKTVRTSDPLPPAMPSLDTDLHWTALPEASGRARGVLKWPASPDAAGYVVWEATESALRHILGAQPEVMPRGTSLVDRATDLQNVIGAAQDASLQAFARLNTRLIPDAQIEVDLPGSASTIYAYRVSAVSDSNVESSKSTKVALLAVPHRNQPGQPRLMLRLLKGTGVDVIAIPTPGSAVAGYRVYRVASQGLISDAGLMGPPKYLEGDKLWRDYMVAPLRGKPEAARALTDPVGESWYPYYYCVIAVGVEDPPNGGYAADSPPSAVQQIVLPPTQLVLEGVSSQANNVTAVVTFRTNLPVRKTSAGPARITLVRVDQVNNAAHRVSVFSVAPEEVPEGAALVPVMNPQALPLITRRTPDQNGVAEYTVMVRASDVPLKIAVRDPLGRSLEK